MKNTIVFITQFLLVTFLLTVKTSAYLPAVNLQNTKLVITIPTAVPTAVPTSTKIINPNLIKIIVTTAPTVAPTSTPVVVTQVVTATKAPIKIIKGTEATVTSTPSTTSSKETISPTATAENIPKSNGLNGWFMGITLGLLALILVIQFWPKKKKEN
jgi:uncharacterized transporter YbjL